MALVYGIHVLAKGDRADALRIAQDIQQHQRLLVGPHTWHGAGAYAWHPDRLPDNLRNLPHVLFEIDDAFIVDICRRDGTPWGFFRIPGNIGSYVSISVVEFVNVG